MLDLYKPFREMEDLIKEMERRIADMLAGLNEHTALAITQGLQGELATIRLQLPKGIGAPNIAVTSRKGQLEIKGRYHSSQPGIQRQGSFYHMISLPQGISSQDVSAEVTDGQLIVQFAKPGPKSQRKRLTRRKR